MANANSKRYAAYGIRAGDIVRWKGPAGAEGRVRSVDYANGIAFIDGLGWNDWYGIDALWVQMMNESPNDR